MADMTDAFYKLGEEILDLAVEKHFETEGMFDPETGAPLQEDHYEQNFVPGTNNWESVKQALGPDLPDLFASFGLPDPDKFTDLVADLDEVITLINSEQTSYIDSATLGLDDWTGTAVDKFKINYVADWYDKLQAHRELAASLHSAMDSSQKLYDRAHGTVEAIGATATEALENVDAGWDWPWSGQDTFNIALTLAGFIVAVAATPLATVTAIGAAGLALNAVNTVKSAATTPTIASSTAMDVIMETRSRLGELSADIVENERVAAQEVLASNTAELAGGLRAVLPPEPDLASIDPQSPGKSIYYAG